MKEFGMMDSFQAKLIDRMTHEIRPTEYRSDKGLNLYLAGPRSKELKDFLDIARQYGFEAEFLRIVTKKFLEYIPSESAAGKDDKKAREFLDHALEMRKVAVEVGMPEAIERIDRAFIKGSLLSAKNIAGNVPVVYKYFESHHLDKEQWVVDEYIKVMTFKIMANDFQNASNIIKTIPSTPIRKYILGKVASEIIKRKDMQRLEEFHKWFSYYFTAEEWAHVLATAKAVSL
jgi:hypothetical protein